MKYIRLLHRIQCRRRLCSVSGTKINDAVSSKPDAQVAVVDRVPLKKDLEDIFNARKREVAVSEQSTGLFGNTALTSPEAFDVELSHVINECNGIVLQIEEDEEPGEHTIHLLDKIVERISTLTDLAAFISVHHTDLGFRAAASGMCSNAEKYTQLLNRNPKLLKSLQTVVSIPKLDSESRGVANGLLKDFKLAGAHLSQNKQQEVIKIQNEIAKTGVEFIKTCFKPTTIPLKSCPDVLLGLPLKNDKIVVDQWFHDNTQDSLREHYWKQYYKYDKKKESMLHKILDQRQALAKSTGYKNYAQRAMQGTMTEDPEVVGEFLQILKKQMSPLAREEMINLELQKQEESRFWHDPVVVMPWDYKYYCQQARLNLISQATSWRMYPSMPDFLSVGVLMEQIGTMFEEIFGVRLVPEIPYRGEVWSEDVVKLAVDHETEGLIGFIYCEFYDNTKDKAPPSHHLIQSNVKGRVPIVVVKCKYEASNGYRPAHIPLTTLDRLFTELGTAIHSLFSCTNFYQSSSSYLSPDVKSVSAQLMQQIGRHAGVLHHVCRHHTRKSYLNQIAPGKLLPIATSYNIFLATDMEQQLLYTAMDHKVHTDWANRGTKSSTDIYAELTEEYTHCPYVDGTAEHLRHMHLFNQGGTYYCNLWSKAIATIIFEEVFKDDPFSKPGGVYFREHFLKHGASCNPRELAENLTGTKLTPQRLATALSKPIQLSKNFETGYVHERGERGVTPLRVPDVPLELTTSPLLQRLSQTHPHMLDDEGRPKEKVFTEDYERLQAIAEYGGPPLLDKVAEKHPHMLDKQGQLKDSLHGEDLVKLEALSKWRKVDKLKYYVKKKFPKSSQDGEQKKIGE